MNEEGFRRVGRRKAVYQMLFGAGLVGLRSLASGIPASVLLNPRRAMAAAPEGGAGDAAAAAFTNPQFVIYSTSSNGDPVNCNAPGTYDDSKIYHPGDPSMASTPMTFGSRTVNGAKIWSTLGPSVLAQTSFFHHGTYTIIHPDEVKVLGLLGQVSNGEMLCSFLSRELSTALGTVRPQPLSLGGNGAGEAIFYQGQPQAFLTPTTLASVLAAPANGLGTANLVALRDQTLDSLNAYARGMGNTAQKNFIDQYATSVSQLRTLQQGLLGSLSAIKDDSQDSQIQAALILFQMKVTPVVAVHVNFGGDNHGDTGLANEIAGHTSGVASISKMMQGIASANLQNQVTFVMSNVFGRTMVSGYNANGRQHNDRHHVTVMIGPGVKGSVIGGPTLAAGAAPGGGSGSSEYAALPIDSSTGLGSPSGDIVYGETMASMGRTLATAVGIPASIIAQNILSGTVVEPALASRIAPRAGARGWTRACIVSSACLAVAAATTGCPPASLDDPGRFDVNGGVSGTDRGGNGQDGGALDVPGEGGACPGIPQFFAATCTNSSCHNASDQAQGLDLQSPDVASRLVSVMATEGPGLLVDPSAPGASILYLKLTASPPFGAEMPLGQKPLPEAMTACVLDWIESGEMASANPVETDAGSASDAMAAVTEGADAGMSCQTTMDANGFMRCSCLAGMAPSANAVASCTGYDCCMRFAPDSGLMEGFGDQSLSSNLCACYSSADIAAIYGASVTCQHFAGGGGAMIVKSCP